MANSWWSSAGSAGTVDVADISKVVFANSVVQLQGFDLVPPEHSAPGLPVVHTHAVIRYGVTPVGDLLRQGVPNLLLRYRNGSGQVAAALMEVDIQTGTETGRIRFDSQGFPSSNAFQVQSVEGGFTFDFENHAYYIELTLTATSRPGLPILFPPKVSVIQVLVVMP